MKQATYLTTNFENFVWIDITNPSKAALSKIAEEHDLNLFQLGDSIETGHLPKFERLPNHDFLILRAYTAPLNNRVTTIPDLSNKIAFFYNNEKLITIHKMEFDFLTKLTGNFASTEELLLHFIVQMIESYTKPTNALSDKIDVIERVIFLKDHTKVSLEVLYFLKAQTRITKKLLHITQNVINQLDLDPRLKFALQDVKDSLLSLLLNYDEVMENANGLLNTYHSVSAQKSNDVMKLLTIFSAFFLPLTFLAGIYGMNFDYMPELKLKYGYGLTWFLMIAISFIIFIWFRRKRIL